MVSRAGYAALAVVCMSTASAAAQADRPLLPSRSITAPVVAPLGETPAQQLQALEKWTKDYESWRVWYARWANQPEPGWMAAHGRRPRPDPPSWLAAACASLIEDSGTLFEGCKALEMWRRTGIASDPIGLSADRTDPGRSPSRSTRMRIRPS